MRLDVPSRADRAAHHVVRVAGRPAVVRDRDLVLAVVEGVRHRRGLELLQLDVEADRLQNRLEILRDQRVGPAKQVLARRVEEQLDLDALPAGRLAQELGRPLGVERHLLGGVLVEPRACCTGG